MSTRENIRLIARSPLHLSPDYYIFMILDENHRICGLKRLVYANDIPSARIFQEGWQRDGEEGETKRGGLNRSFLNDLIDQSIGYTVKTFERVEDALHNALYTKMNFVE